jgi:cytochrome c peroxidase
LPEGDLGPRAVVIVGRLAYVANYFSDTLTVLELDGTHPKAESIPLGPKPQMTAARQGELHFNDARICFQGWQSCASCHPGDARVDALNWDLLNDGIGNPKNNKSLLLVHKTPPAMSTGVRESAEVAVRAGIRHILFTVQPPEVADSMDAYLKSLKPVPSPHLLKGKLSAAARQGEKIFHGGIAGCAQCHPRSLFTDLKSYDVGTRGRFDKPSDVFDTPTLIELWRTAPYLHDGSAATIRDVLTTANKNDYHGKTSHLTADQLNDLIEYLLSL